MPAPSHMPNGGGNAQLVALVHDVREDLRALDAMLRGNGGPGVMEQVRANRAAIEEIREDWRAREKPTAAAQEAKWRAWAEISVAVGVVASLLLHLLNLIGGP